MAKESKTELQSVQPAEAETVVEMVDLSPEALESKRNLESAGPSLLDKGRVQAIVEDWRQRNPFVKDILSNRGEQVPTPPMPVTQQWLAAMERMIKPLIQDCCEDTESVVRHKIAVQRRSQVDGAAGVESLATPLAPLRGNLTVPPTPSR